MENGNFRAARSSFILRITYPQSSVMPPLAGSSGRRPPGMWRSPEPFTGSGGRPGLTATHAAWRRWWQPPKASLGHPGDVHFGLLKPISFIPWLWNGQVWPKGPYPNQTKEFQNGRSSFILKITYPLSSVTPPLAGPGGRRPPGMWRSPEPSPGSGGRPGLRATHAAWRRWWQNLQRSVSATRATSTFGLLKPISFIPWLRNGQVWPKGPYPNQTKPKISERSDYPLSSG